METLPGQRIQCYGTCKWESGKKGSFDRYGSGSVVIREGEGRHEGISMVVVVGEDNVQAVAIVVSWSVTMQ